MAEAISDTVAQEIEQLRCDIKEMAKVIADQSRIIHAMLEALGIEGEEDEAEQAGKQAYAMQQEGGTLPPGSERAEGDHRGNGTIHAVACGSKSLNNLISGNFGSHSGDFGSSSEKGSHVFEKGSHSGSGVGFGDGSYPELSDRQVMAMIMVHGKREAEGEGLSAEAYAKGWGLGPEAAAAWGDQEKLKRAEALLLHAMADLDRYRGEYGPLPDDREKLADWKRRAKAHLSGSIVHDDIPGDNGGQGGLGKKPDWPVIHCPACGGARKWKQGKVLKGWVRRCEECGGEE